MATFSCGYSFFVILVASEDTCVPLQSTRMSAVTVSGENIFLIL